MDTLFSIALLYSVFAAFWFVFSVIGWCAEIANYRENKWPRSLRQARFFMLQAACLGTLWMPVLIMTIYRAIKTTMEG